MTKSEARAIVRELKSAVSVDEKICAAKSMQNKLSTITQIGSAKHILLYKALPDELSTEPLLTEWSQAKQLFLPRVNGDILEILPYDKNALSEGSFHIKEPIGSDIVDINKIDIVIVPGIAFDKNGNRVGRGKGYYDRLLQSSTTLKIGVCYDFQLLKSIECEPHDIKMDIIVTDKQIYYT